MNNNPRRKFHKNSKRHYNKYKKNPNAKYSAQRRAQPRQVTAEEAVFMKGTPVDPSPRIVLEKGSKDITMRAMDLICPIGMGQRGLIVAPPGSGKTTFLKHICQATAKSCPDMKIYCLLVDERPEEVTDFKREVPADVRHSSMDDDYEHHIEVAEQVMKDIFKDCAEGKNVMLLIDSLTRLSRVHNAQRPSGGRTMSGGVDTRALEVPRRMFGSARKIEDGGSLTILATILVDTDSRMDEVIFEEFKGTGNMEIVLSREISEHRIFPAIDVRMSNTRKSELLLADDFDAVENFRRILAGYGNPVEAAKVLIERLQSSASNEDLLSGFKK